MEDPKIAIFEKRYILKIIIFGIYVRFQGSISQSCNNRFWFIYDFSIKRIENISTRTTSQYSQPRRTSDSPKVTDSPAHPDKTRLVPTWIGQECASWCGGLGGVQHLDRSGDKEPSHLSKKCTQRKLPIFLFTDFCWWKNFKWFKIWMDFSNTWLGLGKGKLVKFD